VKFFQFEPYLSAHSSVGVLGIIAPTGMVLASGRVASAPLDRGIKRKMAIARRKIMMACLIFIIIISDFF
jgi:hypothetical protein